MSTPPRPKANKGSPGASPSQPQPLTAHEKSELTQLMTITFKVRPDWQKWCRVIYTIGEKGWNQKNEHQLAVFKEFCLMQDRKIMKLHGKQIKTANGVEDNPQYEWYPGWGNCANVETVLVPTPQFIKGVYNELVNKCWDDIAHFEFRIDSAPDNKFENAKSYTSVDEFIQAVVDLPVVAPPDDEEELPEAKGRIIALEERVAALEQKLTALCLQIDTQPSATHHLAHPAE